MRKVDQEVDMPDKFLSFIPFFSKDIDDAEKKKFYLELLILFILLLLLNADYWFSIEGKVRMIVGEKNIPYVINALEVIFCCLIVLLVLAVIIIIISAIFMKFLIKSVTVRTGAAIKHQE